MATPPTYEGGSMSLEVHTSQLTATHPRDVIAVSWLVATLAGCHFGELLVASAHKEGG